MNTSQLDVRPSIQRRGQHAVRAYPSCEAMSVTYDVAY